MWNVPVKNRKTWSFGWEEISIDPSKSWTNLGAIKRSGNFLWIPPLTPSKHTHTLSPCNSLNRWFLLVEETGVSLCRWKQLCRYHAVPCRETEALHSITWRVGDGWTVRRGTHGVIWEQIVVVALANESFIWYIDGRFHHSRAAVGLAVFISTHRMFLMKHKSILACNFMILGARRSGKGSSGSWQILKWSA